ncbi:MAG: endonuclease/exonuclease/phosphatase family protein [Paludibacteraceae bacterium]|nr:endonuclease/exonuclease/phosphatase family protein [Paludibacteraceae bacterium]
MKKKATKKPTPKLWLKILKAIALSLTILTLLYYVLLLAVPYIHPSRIHIISWIGLTMPFAILAVFIWLIIWIIARQRGIWITLAVILLATFPIWRRTIVMNIGGDYPSTEEIATGHQLKILTYNVEFFHYFTQIDQIIDLVRQGGYDIVCMQEYGHKSTYPDQWFKLNQCFDSLFKYRHVWYKSQSRNAECGVVLYSRYPIVKKVKVQYDSRYNVSIYSDIAVGDDTIRVFNNHLESNKLNTYDRMVAGKITDENVDNESLYRSFRTVLRKIADASIIRATQVDSITAIIQQTPYPVIILGDFNDVPQSYAYNKLIRSKHLGATSSMSDAYAMAGDWLYYYTFNQDHLNVPIDHILVSPEFSVQESSILPLTYSDHYPVSATLLLRKQNP